MQVSFEVPEDIARVLASAHESLDRAVLDSLAAEGYRSGLLSESQVMRLLHLPSRFAVHDWLLLPNSVVSSTCWSSSHNFVSPAST